MTTNYGFNFKGVYDDRLFIDRIPVEHVIKRLSSPTTPFLLYSLKQFRHNIDAYEKAFKKHSPIPAHLSYSMKANYNPHLLSILKCAKVKLTTVSSGEMQLALSYGFEVSFTKIRPTCYNLFFNNGIHIDFSFVSHQLLSTMVMVKVMKAFKWRLILVYYLT